ASGTDRPALLSGSSFATGSAVTAPVRSAGFAPELATDPMPKEGTPTGKAAPTQNEAFAGGPVVSSPIGAGPTSFAEMGPDCCGNCCGDECCADCCCGWGHRVYGSAEFLLWALRDQRFPALVTTGNPSSVLPGSLVRTGGFLSDPTTRVLFG